LPATGINREISERKEESTMKIGFVSMPLSGHLNPMTALARKLQSRGGGVRFFGVPDIGPAVRAANLAFEAYCEEEYPAGSVARIYAPIAKLHGLDVLRYQAEEISPKFLQAGLKHLPQSYWRQALRRWCSMPHTASSSWCR
jgi:zeaxanthin glucosyltransferase